MTHIIDGRAQAKIIKESLKKEIAGQSIIPSLSVILIGNDPASQIYVERKKEAAQEVGIKGQIQRLPESATQQEVIGLIHNLNNDHSVNGILLQLPLPDHLNSHEIINHIDPIKDVDGLTVTNMGKLLSGAPDMIPCTPQGVFILLHTIYENLCGRHAVIIGRSLLFGKPMGQLLLNADCTVTQCHSKTKNIKDICAQADILIAATGQANMIKADWVKDGAVVIDVGISRDDNNKITGDVDFENVKDKASAITPVPGGVGPMTIACLLKNTVKASNI
jgi:methylenetetrahydrofolate dehydrogenase (NADP+)/methenyltetrahydrofolate cyclohydrolase